MTRFVNRNSKFGFVQGLSGLIALVCLAVVPLHARGEGEKSKALDFRGVQIDKEKKSVTFPAVINMVNGMLEYLIVADTGKTHESLLSTKIHPQDIQVAMLLLGIEPARTSNSEPPAQINKEYLATAPPLKGAKINVYVEWQDTNGGHRVRAENLIWNVKENAQMTEGLWIYNGSEMYGGTFLAQADGSVAALVTDSAALINNPRPGNDDDQIWKVNGKAVPKEGTTVEVTIELEEGAAK